MFKIKKAIFFSTDALIAISIIIMAILVLYPTIKYSLNRSELSSDVGDVLSSLKIGEFDNPYVDTLIASGEISDLNKSLVEQIGELYVKNKTKAELLGKEILSSLHTQDNIGIWYGGSLIASINSSSFEASKNVDLDRQFVSGIREGGNLTGYSARAYLTKTVPSTYSYFGGYVGDGNISMTLDYSGVLRDLALEIAINQEFDIYINGVFSGHYDKSPSQFTPANYDLSSYLGRFHNGSNLLEFKGENLYIAGGFVKISYEGSVSYSDAKKSYLPGIQGIINLYDGISFPSNFTSVEIYLHYLSNNRTLFMNLGNVTLVNETYSSERYRTISDSELRNLFNYDSLKDKTIPLRLGLEGVTSSIYSGGNADIILITDVSGSMGYRLNSNNQGNKTRTCDDPLLYDNSTARIALARCLAKNFTDKVLSAPGNRVALVSFDDSTVATHSLSTNLVSLNSQIEDYDAGGSTCICCGINSAYNILNSQSSPSRQKFIVLMSDGEANYRCTNIKNCAPNNAPQYCSSGSPSKSSCFAGTGTSGYNCGDSCSGAMMPALENSIWSTNRTSSLLGANVSTIGFRLGNCFNGNYTLSEMARVGNGKYMPANDAEELLDAYAGLASEFLSLSYSEQVSNVSGNVSTILYPDSYIKINQTNSQQIFGVVYSSETLFTDNNHGEFYVPANSQVLESRVISYSGPRWTSRVYVNGFLGYNLASYGDTYLSFGDPYSIRVPSSLLIFGNNRINLSTGISPNNFSEGSSSNKIIITTFRNASTFSPISSSAEGCVWGVEFEDSSNLTLAIPLDYTGLNRCYYSSTRQEYNINDALQNAVYALLKILDYNSDNKIDTKFAEQDLQVNSFTVTGIPYTWSTEVQIRRWY